MHLLHKTCPSSIVVFPSLECGVMTADENHNYKANVIKFMGNEFNTIAKNLFNDFRNFDKEKVDLIIAEGISDRGLGLAIMNRLKRASYKTIKV